MQALLLSRSGALWLGTSQEVICVHPDGSQPPFTMPVTSPVRCLHEDRSGGIWAGFYGGGLARLSLCEAVGVQLTFGEKVRAANSVWAAGDGAWWVGTNAGLFSLRDGRATHVEAVNSHSVNALHRDQDGTLWLGRSSVLGRLRGEEYRGFPAPVPVGIVRAIARDARGRLLLGTEAGVWEFNDVWHPYKPAAALRDDVVKMIVPWSDGGTWLVGQRSVLRLSAGEVVVTHLRRGKDLPTAEVRAVLPGSGDRVWFATYGSGLVGIEGDRRWIVGPAHGLSDAYVCSATPLGPNWLMGGNRGPYLLDPTALDRFADGAAEAVTCRALACNARISTEANGGVQPSVSTQAGVAAVCGINGIWMIDTKHLRHDLPAPVCHVQPLPSGDQTVERTPAGDVVHAHADRTVLLACTAPEFNSPGSISFRWRLADGRWSQSLPRAPISVVLPSAGQFVIEVVAIDAAGRESDSPARLRVLVAPFVWERRWFPWVCGLLLLAGGWTVFRFGSRRSARQAAQLRTLVDARTVELLRARDSLKQRVQQRTSELRLAVEQLGIDHEERVRLERELEQMRRMESLGQLAGSVAHDFNNLLTVVFGNAQMLELELARGEVGDLRDLTARILAAAVRGRELTQRLLAVASRQTVVPHVIDLGDVLRAQMGVVGDLMGSTVRVDLVLPDESLRVCAAPGQIEQIVMNLAVNARSAMPNGGVFTLRAIREETRIRLSVQDDGPGMAPAVRARAFEPFFTTRPGGGTGLGLATVYGITKQLQGEVTIESAPGCGTCFSFAFPSVEQPVDVIERPVVLSRPAASIEGRRVLLVEDEPEVRRAIARLLQVCGCLVVGEAACGADAVRALAESAMVVDVVVSDVSMPGLQGVDLVRALRAIRPGLPILFVSGHTSTATFLAEIGPLGIELIAKPPTREELLPALDRAMLGRRSVPRSAT